MSKGRVRLLQGNEACVEGALAAGLRFFAGYPITPSTEIAELLSERLPRLGGKFIQMEDEIASMGAVIGASLAGCKAMTATSGPGFSLKQENLGYAAYCEIPCVVVNVQRVGPSTGMPTSPASADMQQARWGSHGDRPAISFMPSSVRETFDLAVLSFNVAERLRTPVVFLLDEVVGHMRESVVLPEPGSIKVEDRKKPSMPPREYVPFRGEADLVPPMASFGEGYRYHVTGLTHDERGFPTQNPKVATQTMVRLMEKVERVREEITLVDYHHTEDSDIIVFSYGSMARPSFRAVRDARAQGLRVGMIRAATIWPFPTEEVRRATKNARVIICPEMNMGQMALEVERAVGPDKPVLKLPKVGGELHTPSEILEAIKGA
jgi:2-oxoglutarate ferredoxin oxidoreductase subunit alpha